MFDSMNMARAFAGHMLPKPETGYGGTEYAGEGKGITIKNMSGVTRETFLLAKQLEVTMVQ